MGLERSFLGLELKVAYILGPRDRSLFQNRMRTNEREENGDGKGDGIFSVVRKKAGRLVGMVFAIIVGFVYARGPNAGV